MKKNYIVSKSDLMKPNKLGISDTYCDPHFFDPIAHKAHAEMMVTDKAYIDHMIPHHQVAVDMSKRLLEHTRSDFMTYLAYRIIRSQEAEIKLLYDLKSSDVRPSSHRTATRAPMSATA